MEYILLFAVLSTLLQPTLCRTASSLHKEPENIHEVDINIDKSVFVTDERFLSIAIGSSLVRHNWEKFDFSSQKLQNLMRGLQPAFLRIGGTDEDFLIFGDESSSTGTGRTTAQHGTHQSVAEDFTKHPFTNFTMTPSDVDKIFQLAKETGVNIIFGLNVLLRTHDSNWDSQNAEKLMQYLVSKGYQCSWELGNEPTDIKGLVNHTVLPKQLAKDFKKLRELLEKHPQYGSFVAGPDASSPWKSQQRSDFLTDFLTHVGSNTLNAMTYHQYYKGSLNATLPDFYDVHLLDDLLTDMTIVRKIIEHSKMSAVDLWMGETSTTYGGGNAGLSNSYVAGFMWLDKLGIAARFQHSVVIRQTFYGGNYAMIDNNVLDPLPDYWTSLLYKRLVGPDVLMVKDGLVPNRIVRVYSHCTSLRSHYNTGSIVLIVMNTLKQNTELSLIGSLKGLPVDQYLLTPGTEGNVTSQSVRLNGKIIQLVDGKSLPVLEPLRIESGKPFIMPQLSYGFYVVPDAKAKACMKNVHQSTDNNVII